METKKIYEAINQVMNDLEAIGKNSKNASQGFMFRGIDDVMNALSPALKKHKIFIVPELKEMQREEKTTSKGALLTETLATISFHFTSAEDGSEIIATTIGEGMDTGDKSANKAMSVAFKYACFQVFCIPTKEMEDPDRDTYELGTNQEKQKPQRRKINAEELSILKDVMEKANVSDDRFLAVVHCKPEDLEITRFRAVLNKLKAATK